MRDESSHASVLILFPCFSSHFATWLPELRSTLLSTHCSPFHCSLAEIEVLHPERCPVEMKTLLVLLLCLAVSSRVCALLSDQDQELLK